MLSRWALAAALILPPVVLSAQNKLAILGVTPEPVSTPFIDVDYSGTLPADRSPYTTSASWLVWWRQDPDSDPESVSVDIAHSDFDSTPQVIRLKLSGDLPRRDLMTASYWTVEFHPPNTAKLLPQIRDFVPSRTPPSEQANSPSHREPVSEMPSFAPPNSGEPADISVSGSFLAGGGTKPIYGFELLGGLYRPSPLKQLFNFYPGVTVAVEINQAATPPSNRTTFDPDSITAAISLQRIKQVQRWHISEIQFDEAVPSGEFDRFNPSSDLLFKSSLLFGTNPWLSRKNSGLYGTFYPVLALEAGRNLNKPRQLAGTSVNLVNYNAILRGEAGAEAKLAFAKADRVSEFLSLSGTYRVRLPAFDEPFLETHHQVTTASLTTKARHWVEGNFNYTLPSFKYLSMNAKYQYGELPPIFTLVDHKFTFGLTLQVVQSNKPGILSVVQ